ncbi:MAG: cytochrome c oxidase assembly protein, partial [Cyanobacteria bacterium REEB65]|nr:cytochrome c oxidase assembly protein [Cyanobacteria bacterium REEB65]
AQTRFEYYSLHMFFLDRVQHLVMHHQGPFLMALGGAGGALRVGMPASLRHAVEHPWVRRITAFLQQPLVAITLFSGTFCFWLLPPVAFRAMVDPQLYSLMNWTLILDGILFWSLVVDPRPKPPARISYLGRAGLAIAVIFPQMIMAEVVGFSRQDLYPFYTLCGRLIPSIGAMADQHYAAYVIFYPPAMMSVIALLIVLDSFWKHAERTGKDRYEAIGSFASLARE